MSLNDRSPAGTPWRLLGRAGVSQAGGDGASGTVTSAEPRRLGPLEMLDHGGALVAWAARKGAALLAVKLAVHANQVVSEDRLVDVGGDDAPRTATRTPRPAISAAQGARARSRGRAGDAGIGAGGWRLRAAGRASTCPGWTLWWHRASGRGKWGDQVGPLRLGRRCGVAGAPARGVLRPPVAVLERARLDEVRRLIIDERS